MQKPQKPAHDGSLVKRLCAESLKTLRGYAEDPDTAIALMKAELDGKLIKEGGPVAVSTCKFDEARLKTLIKDSMEEVLAPFIGEK